jgi:hypothetical protein
VAPPTAAAVDTAHEEVERLRGCPAPRTRSSGSRRRRSGQATQTASRPRRTRDSGREPSREARARGDAGPGWLQRARARRLDRSSSTSVRRLNKKGQAHRSPSRSPRGQRTIELRALNLSSSARGRSGRQAARPRAAKGDLESSVDSLRADKDLIAKRSDDFKNKLERANATVAQRDAELAEAKQSAEQAATSAAAALSDARAEAAAALSAAKSQHESQRTEQERAHASAIASLGASTRRSSRSGRHAAASRRSGRPRVGQGRARVEASHGDAAGRGRGGERAGQRDSELTAKRRRKNATSTPPAPPRRSRISSSGWQPPRRAHGSKRGRLRHLRLGRSSRRGPARAAESRRRPRVSSKLPGVQGRRSRD